VPQAGDVFGCGGQAVSKFEQVFEDEFAFCGVFDSFANGFSLVEVEEEFFVLFDGVEVVDYLDNVFLSKRFDFLNTEIVHIQHLRHIHRLIKRIVVQSLHRLNNTRQIHQRAQEHFIVDL